MKKILIVYLLMASYFLNAQTDVVGIGTTNPSVSAALDITNNSKTLLIPRLVNTSAISEPINGMIIYDISSQCVKGYQNGAWTECGFIPNQVLVQIGIEADDNTVTSIVTVTQLASIPGITGVDPTKEAAYQAYIDANPNLFSSPATVAEVNDMIQLI